jgi:cytochrome c6
MLGFARMLDSASYNQWTKRLQTLIFATGLMLFGLLVSMPNALAGNAFAGQSIYNSHCAGCHGGDGRGVMAGTPSFQAGSPALAKPDFRLKELIQKGKGVMPAFKNILKEDQIYDVIAHLRTFY